MNNPIYLVLLFLFSQSLCFSQNSDCTYAKNIQSRIILDGEKIEVTYDLPANKGHIYFDVSLKTNKPDVYPKTYVTGTGARIEAGNGKKITWYYKRDGYESAQLNDISLLVKAQDPLDPCEEEEIIPDRTKVKIPITAGIATLGATGLTLVTTGAISMGNNSEGSEDYQLYKNNTDPNDPVWNDTPRSEFYDQLNSDYKKGQLLLIGGAAVIVTGGVIMLSRMMRNKKIEKGLTVRPTYQPDIRLSGNSPLGGTVGMGLVYTF